MRLSHYPHRLQNHSRKFLSSFIPHTPSQKISCLSSNTRTSLARQYATTSAKERLFNTCTKRPIIHSEKPTSTFITQHRCYSRPNWYNNPPSNRSSGIASSLQRLGRSLQSRLGGSPPNQYQKARANGLLASLNRTNPHTVVYWMIGANAVVFIAWQYGRELYRQEGDPKLLTWLQRNFTAGYRNVVQERRWWGLITSSFSHSQVDQFLVNMLVLFSFGPAVASTIGTASFLFLYTASAIASSMTSIAYHSLKMRRPDMTSNGASGALMGSTVVYACMYPTAQIYLFFFIPVPAALAFGGFVAYDLYRSLAPHGRSSGAMVDSAGRLGGMMTGMAYYVMKIRRGRW